MAIKKGKRVGDKEKKIKMKMMDVVDKFYNIILQHVFMYLKNIICSY